MSQTVLRAFNVLSAVARSKTPLTFSTLPDACTGIPPATMARTVKFLLKDKYLAKTADGTYAVGKEAVGFARTLIGGAVPRDHLVRETVNELAEAAGESAAYYEMDGDRLILVAKKEKPQSFHYLSEGSRPGRLHDHLFSQAINAFKGRDALLKRTAQMEKLFAQIREAGCTAGPENANMAISRVVFPVFGIGSNPAGSIGVTVLNPDIPGKRVEELKKAVKSAADELSRIFKENHIQEI